MTMLVFLGSLAALPASPAQRLSDGAVAMARVSVRVIATSVSVGAAFPPPQPRMVPRRVETGGGARRALALIYDLE